MEWALLQSASQKNNRVVPVSPKVKSAKTCKLANNDGRNLDRTAKSVDPIVYNSVTVELTGLFETMEMKMKALHKKGDTVNIFQMSVSKGLIFEGKAVILKVLDPNGMDEYYHVRFLGQDGKPQLDEEYDRFVDRQGQGDPDQYVKEINKKLCVGT